MNNAQEQRKTFIDEYNKNPKLCLYCHNVIEIKSKKDTPSLINKRKFCNVKCALSFSHEFFKKEKKCKNADCNKEFITTNRSQVYCDECNEKLKIIHICKYCNGEFYSNYSPQKFCSQLCARSFRQKEYIKKFLNGGLSDQQVRKTDSIRKYIMEQQSNVCQICHKPPVHYNKPLTFILDHIDGNWRNNFPSNIRLICPNCNSQTETFNGRNKKKKLNLVTQG